MNISSEHSRNSAFGSQIWTVTPLPMFWTSKRIINYWNMLTNLDSACTVCQWAAVYRWAILHTVHCTLSDPPHYWLCFNTPLYASPLCPSTLKDDADLIWINSTGNVIYEVFLFNHYWFGPRRTQTSRRKRQIKTL